jgi:hypothetical protein
MKTSSAYVFALACLASASVALANETNTQLAHQHLTFNSAVTVYELNADAGEKLTVTRRAMPHAVGEAPRFEVTIATDRDGNHAYSMLTLGIQSVTLDVTILAAPTGPGGAVFNRMGDNPVATKVVDPANGLAINKTGLKGTPAAIDDANIWLMAFKGKTCTLLIEITPDRNWTTEWTPNMAGGFGTSHVTETPH